MYYLSLLVIVRNPAATITAPTRELEICCTPNSRMDIQERLSGCSGRDAAVLRDKGLPLDGLPSFNASSFAVRCFPAVFMSWSCKPFHAFHCSSSGSSLAFGGPLLPSTTASGTVILLASNILGTFVTQKGLARFSFTHFTYVFKDLCQLS